MNIFKRANKDEESKKPKYTLGCKENPRKVGVYDFTGNYQAYKDSTPRRAIEELDVIVIFGNKYFRIDRIDRNLSIRYKYATFNTSPVELINMSDVEFKEYIEDKMEV